MPNHVQRIDSIPKKIPGINPRCLVQQLCALCLGTFDRPLECSTRETNCLRLIKKGVFTVNKSNIRFSDIRLDQNHEQLNYYLKHCGGIVGLTENPAALQRFLICSPLVSDLCRDFEERSLYQFNTDGKINPRHAEASYMQRRFINDHESLLKMILTRGNPFSLTKEKLINIYTHEEAPSSSIVYSL